MTSMDSVPVGDRTLGELQWLPPRRQHIAARAAADALPPEAVAHRLGDFIFIHHADLENADRRLWVVVRLPDPDVNGRPSAIEPIHVGLADGTVRKLVYLELPVELETQNEHRGALSLPPLPDLTTITQDSPAIPPQDDP